MKIKWLIGIVAAISLLTLIPFPMYRDVNETVTLKKKPMNISVEKISVTPYGKLQLNHVLLTHRADTLRCEMIEVVGGIFKLMALKNSLDTLKENIQLDEYSEAFFSALEKVRSVHGAGVKGNLFKIDLTDGTFRLKRSFGKVKGTAEFPEITLWGVEQGEQRVQFTFGKKQNRFSVKSSIGGGSLEGSVKTAGTAHALEEFSLRGRGIRMEKLFTDSLSGKADFSFELTGSDSLPSGEGSVRVIDFEDRNSALLSRLRSTLGYVGVDSLAFDRIEADVRLHEGALVSDSLVAEGDILSVHAAGKTKMKTGSYSYDVTGYLPESTKENVSSVIWEGLLPDTVSGGRYFHGSVRGVGKRYVVKVDQQIIKRSVKSFFRGIFKK